jgi:hypothetical protein
VAELHLVHRQPNGSFRSYESVSIRSLGLSEADLESFVAEHLEMLGIAELVAGPYRVFPQSVLPGRVRTDLLVVTAAGELWVIEVKLEDNPELRGRGAVAQLMDYAARLSECQPKDLARIFSGGGDEVTLGELFDAWFPGMPNLISRRTAFERSVRAGRIWLVLAADHLPAGTYDWIERLGGVSGLPFRLIAVETVPYRCSEDGSVFFVPSRRVQTEVLSRVVVEQAGESSAKFQLRVEQEEPIASQVSRSATDLSASGSLASAVKGAAELLPRSGLPFPAPRFSVFDRRTLVAAYSTAGGVTWTVDVTFELPTAEGFALEIKIFPRDKQGEPDRAFVRSAEGTVMVALQTAFGEASSAIHPNQGVPVWRCFVRPQERVLPSSEWVASVALKVYRCLGEALAFP